MTNIAKLIDEFTTIMPSPFQCHYGFYFSNIKSTPNKPISNSKLEMAKAMPDMNKARSEKAIYGRFIA